MKCRIMIFQNVNPLVFRTMIKPHMNLIKKDNALGSAKIFLSTIPDTFFVYRDGVKSQPVPRISELTGLPMIVDYDTAYAKVLKYLCDCDLQPKLAKTLSLSILGKCKLLGETDPFFAMLYTVW